MFTLPVVAVLVQSDGRTVYQYADGTKSEPKHTIINLSLHPAEWLAWDEAYAKRGQWVSVK